jgi:hypothetical protein
MLVFASPTRNKIVILSGAPKDDDFVEVSTKNILNEVGLMGRSPGMLYWPM